MESMCAGTAPAPLRHRPPRTRRDAASPAGPAAPAFKLQPPARPGSPRTRLPLPRTPPGVPGAGGTRELGLLPPPTLPGAQGNEKKKTTPLDRTAAKKQQNQRREKPKSAPASHPAPLPAMRQRTPAPPEGHPVPRPVTWAARTSRDVRTGSGSAAAPAQ